jgi:hypothetical protein
VPHCFPPPPPLEETDSRLGFSCLFHLRVQRPEIRFGGRRGASASNNTKPPYNAVNEKVLCNLTAEDLKDLGVGMIGHRRMLLDAIALLRAEPTTKAPPPEAPSPLLRPSQDSAESALPARLNACRDKESL